MDDLFPLIVIISIISSIASSIKKSTEKKKAEARRTVTPPVQPAKPAAPKPFQPAQPTVFTPMSFGDVPGQVIAPTVHTHVQPNCETHDAPGSLGFVSSEGKDPCHEEQLQSMRNMPMQTAEPQSGLTFDWSGENMVKAFVMQEVLTRPCQRQGR